MKKAGAIAGTGFRNQALAGGPARPGRDGSGGGRKTRSDGRFALLLGPDADHLVEREHEDLAVANLAGLG